MSLVARPLGLALYFTRIHMEPEVSLLVVMMVFLTMVDVVVVEVFSSMLQHVVGVVAVLSWWMVWMMCRGQVTPVTLAAMLPRIGVAAQLILPHHRSRLSLMEPKLQCSLFLFGFCGLWPKPCFLQV